MSAEAKRLLADKVAGEPVSCISAFDAVRPVDLPGGGVLYHRSNDEVFVQNFGGTCDIRTNDEAYLIRTSTMTQLCRGEIAQAISRVNNVQIGACVYSDFVPYRAATK